MSTASTMTPMMTPIQMMSTNRSRPSVAYSERGFHAVCGVSPHAQASRAKPTAAQTAAKRRTRRAVEQRCVMKLQQAPVAAVKKPELSIGTRSGQRQAKAPVGDTLQTETFASEVVGCRACEVAGYLERANPIRPGLIAQPRMMLIGQAPGTVSDRKGYHFAGPAGRFLEIWLEQAGFPEGYFREHVYLTSLTRCFPGKGKSGHGDRPPSRAEIALCSRFLNRELGLIQPKVVLLVGKMAIDAFVGKQPLAHTVGKVFEASGR